MAAPANDPSWSQVGRWDPVFSMPNVAIHTHVLPNGRVLFWGRRDDPADSLNEHACTPYLWDPATDDFTPTPQPMLADGSTVNLFCSGHTFLPDGRLLVAGGHLTDGDGVNQACTYDYRTTTWTPLSVMNNGRWYPTATTLADGRVLVSSGSFATNGTVVVNDVLQIWDGTRWQQTVNFIGLPLYPRMHVAPDAQVFMSGSNATTYLLNTDNGGNWAPLPGPGGSRQNGERQYAPSVMYAPGKVIYIGGGNDAGTDLPSAATEVIDLGVPAPAWQGAASMRFRRRQHNATILPDGTVLVTGGTSGPGFNDLSPGKPVHVAELWNPETDTWTELAAEGVDRCYHATAVLLPDATVLSAGGGEFLVGATPNDPADTHRDAQIFHPPYLFQGPRPQITAAPEDIEHGTTFAVETQGPDIEKVTLVRLPSLTHAFDQNQRINVLAFTAQATTLTASAPAGPGVCPPGHYMLFVLSSSGVPSVARIVRITTPVADPAAAGAELTATASPTRLHEKTTTQQRDDVVRTQSTGTRVTVGLTAKCPYGLGPCWGGAYEALSKLDDVAAVRPSANTADSTAEVYLNHQGLPDLDRWPDQLARWANGSYDFRGVEVTTAGVIGERDGVLHLTAPTLPTPVQLLALQPGTELAWDLQAQRVRPATDDEHNAHRHLIQRWRNHSGGAFAVRVTGPLHKTDTGWSLSVRTIDDEPPPGG